MHFFIHTLFKEKKVKKMQIYCLNFETNFHSRTTENTWASRTWPAGRTLCRPSLKHGGTCEYHVYSPFNNTRVSYD